METFEGGCRCGAVRWRLRHPALPLTYACHCLDCQTWSGTAFSQQTIIQAQNFEVTGDVGRFDLVTSNRVSNQYACPSCFTRVYNTNSARPGLVVVRAGSFDDSHRLLVTAHIWVKRKQPWISIPATQRCWDEGAPQAELFSCIGAPTSV